MADRQIENTFSRMLRINHKGRKRVNFFKHIIADHKGTERVNLFFTYNCRLQSPKLSMHYFHVVQCGLQVINTILMILLDRTDTFRSILCGTCKVEK